MIEVEQNHRLRALGFPVPVLSDEGMTVGCSTRTGEERSAFPLRGYLQAEHDLGTDVEGKDLVRIQLCPLSDAVHLLEDDRVELTDGLAELTGVPDDVGPCQPRIVGEDLGIEADGSSDAVGTLLADLDSSFTRPRLRDPHNRW